jgi:acetyltransferase-like isoleucine patch superfamily enzyme
MPKPNYGTNVLIEKDVPLTKEEKNMFAYFGEHVKIRPPFRFLNPQLIRIGDRTSIREGAFIHAYTDLTYLLDQIGNNWTHNFQKEDYLFQPEIVIGSDVQMGRFQLISCTNSIVIDNHVLFSERIFVGDNNHTFSHPDIPVMLQPNKKGKKIHIGEGTWIGIGSAILPGTQLGKNCVVGANSVVEGVFPSHSVIGPEKAKLLFRRHKD